jgi:maltose alpha-D-glucosyltransferase/alpha-amylase
MQSYRTRAEAAFLEAYRVAVSESPSLGLTGTALGLLDVMLLEKATYEIEYESANRPKWIQIPLRGISALVERLTHTERRA